MKIDIYCVSVCSGDEFTRLAGCGIIIIFTDEHSRTRFRTYQYGLGNSSQNLADLQAARLSLASIKSPFRKYDTCLHINSQHVFNMLSKNGRSFVYEPLEDIVVVKDLRRWFGYYNNIRIMIENGNDDHMTQVFDLANNGLMTQEHIDSGTI